MMEDCSNFTYENWLLEQIEPHYINLDVPIEEQTKKLISSNPDEEPQPEPEAEEPHPEPEAEEPKPEGEEPEPEGEGAEPEGEEHKGEEHEGEEPHPEPER